MLLIVRVPIQTHTQRQVQVVDAYKLYKLLMLSLGSSEQDTE